MRPAVLAEHGVRVLVLTAENGDGHLTVARNLARALSEREDLAPAPLIVDVARSATPLHLCRVAPKREKPADSTREHAA